MRTPTKFSQDIVPLSDMKVNPERGTLPLLSPYWRGCVVPRHASLGPSAGGALALRSHGSPRRPVRISLPPGLPPPFSSLQGKTRYTGGDPASHRRAKAGHKHSSRPSALSL